jgi:hypothetical protein
VLHFISHRRLQERKRSKAALAADAAAASRVPLAVRMSESVTAGMTRALDSSNKVTSFVRLDVIAPGGVVMPGDVAGVCDA